VGLPEFTAGNVLTPRARAHRLTHFRERPVESGREVVQPALITQGSDGELYACDPLYSEGGGTYWDCRQLTGELAPPGSHSPRCVHYTTDTKCLLVSLWCNDRCRYPDGTEGSSGWYPCGACTPSLPFAQPRRLSG
jgi:hypothetical protein